MPAGRPKKPTAVHMLNGNPSKIPNLEQKYDQEVKFDLYTLETLPPAPAWMSARAKACWDECVSFLAAQKLLSVADLMLLEQYCVCYDKWRQNVEELDRVGTTVYKSKTGSAYLQSLPQLFNSTSLGKQLLAIAREFGMTPAARGRMISPEAKEEEDDMERLLSGG
jgi:P27 family predicted phage terminase small subunit